MSERLYGPGDLATTGHSTGPHLRFEFKNVRYHLENLSEEIHEINLEKGFWSNPEMMDKIAAKMMLVVTETAEAIEALRKEQGTDKVTEEFADVVIRLLDLYNVLVHLGWADEDLDGVLAEKIATNRERERKHGNKWG